MPKKLLVSIVTMFYLTATEAQPTAAESITIGLLPYEKCIDVSLQDDGDEKNQRHWDSRSSLVVGWDSTCYLGFPSAKNKWAEVLINNVIVRVYPSSSTRSRISRFSSRDQQTIVEVKVIKSGTSCAPNEDKCCGNYSYGILTVKHMGKTATRSVANYVGG
jgi:hypothetical protein